jgi:hypothetical protein
MVMLAIKIPNPEIFSNVRPGLWVAISQDQDRLICTGETLDEVARMAKEQGEEEPFVMRVPEDNSALIF